MLTINDLWFTVEQIDERTFSISEYGHWEKVHSFLLLGNHNAVLIDTGLGIDSIRKITDQITTLPIIVITTHVHWDHIGSHSQYESIYVHELEEDWLKHGIKGLPLEVIRRDVSKDITLPVPEAFNPSTYMPFTGSPTKLLRDGDLIDIGERRLQIIHTPGHSPGHICVYDITYGYLFTGDLLYEGTIYAFYPTTDPQLLIESLERISKLEELAKIYGSHNRLGLEPEILLEVKEATIYLKENNQVRHGTGIHTFNTFSIHL